MIHIVEVPHRSPAVVWDTESEATFIRTVYRIHETSRSGGTIFERTTARALLKVSGDGLSPETADREEQAAEIDLGETFGWDTVLTRADYSNGEGVYKVDDSLTEFAACCDYIRQDLSCCYIYKTDAEAIEGLNSDVDGRAARLLRRQLVDCGALPAEDAEREDGAEVET